VLEEVSWQESPLPMLVSVLSMPLLIPWEGNSILPWAYHTLMLPYIMRYNILGCPHKFAQMAKAFGEKVEGILNSWERK